MIFFNIISKGQQIIFWSLILAFALLAQTKNEKNNGSKPYRFVFSINVFQNIKTEDALASSKVLAKQILKKKDINEDIELLVCNDLEQLVSETKNRFDFALVSPVDVLALKKAGNIKPLLVNQTQGSYGNIYYLITNKSQNIRKITELRHGSIRVMSRSLGQIPFLWLDKILRDNKLPIKEKFFSDISFDFKATNVVLPLFFNKISAALISKTSFDLLCELNPQIAKQAEIIQISEPLLFGVICFDGRNMDKGREKFLFDTLLSLQNDVYGMQLLDLFGVERLIPYKEEYWQNILKVLK